MSIFKQTLNFIIGIWVGITATPIWNYFKLLYYTLFITQAIRMYQILNLEVSDFNKKGGCKNDRKHTQKRKQ